MRSTKNYPKSALATKTNVVPSTSQQTPIEIALRIDENGMTTASNLYAFLELDPKNFSHWCTRNIKNNRFAIENEDYIVFVFENENPKTGGRPKTDYKLTSEFAKKLSMTGNTERHEQARSYFIACEKGLKIAASKLQFNQLELKSLTDTLTAITSTITSMQQDINDLKQPQTPQLETTYKKPYNPWFTKMQPKYKLLEDYFDITRGQLYKNILLELENIYDLDTQQIQADYCYENNLTSCYPLEPYEFMPKYRDMIESIVNSNLIKYGIASETDKITSNKHITIFDSDIKL